MQTERNGSTELPPAANIHSEQILPSQVPIRERPFHGSARCPNFLADSFIHL